MIEKVKDIAREAGEIVMRYYGKDFEVNSKSEDKFDPVSAADLAADAYITKQLKEHFPEDDILSEENPKEVDFDGRVWIVDPIDGTKNFIEKNSYFGILIGLCIDGKPILGVGYMPAREELYYAEKGKGAWMEKAGEKKRLEVATTKKIIESDNFPPRIEKAGLKQLKQKLLEDNHLVDHKFIAGEVFEVAKGDVEIHISNPTACKWDACTIQVITEEAGGKVTDLDGNPPNYKKEGNIWEEPLIFSNSIVHNYVLEELSKLLK